MISHPTDSNLYILWPNWVPVQTYCINIYRPYLIIGIRHYCMHKQLKTSHHSLPVCRLRWYTIEIESAMLHKQSYNWEKRWKLLCWVSRKSMAVTAIKFKRHTLHHTSFILLRFSKNKITSNSNSSSATKSLWRSDQIGTPHYRPHCPPVSQHRWRHSVCRQKFML